MSESSNCTKSSNQDARGDPYVDPVTIKGYTGVATLKTTGPAEIRQGPGIGQGLGDEGDFGVVGKVSKKCWQLGC